jgi:hypothetical protein
MKVYYLAYCWDENKEFEHALAPQMFGGNIFYTTIFELFREKQENIVMLEYSVLPELEHVISRIIEETKNIGGPDTFSSTDTVKPKDIIDICRYEGYHYLASDDEIIFKVCNKILKDKYMEETFTKNIERENEFLCSEICSLW